MPLLARLLAEPGREIHALDLVGAPDLISDRDGGPLLDATAKSAYQQRLRDLGEDLEEARANNDIARVEHIEHEVDLLSDELAASVGLGGRDRRAASQSERARVAATRNLRSVIQRAAAADGSLGRHLSATIKTGTYCSYSPDPRVPVDWAIE
jgi:non-specific serine/threonine protein kinase